MSKLSAGDKVGYNGHLWEVVSEYSGIVTIRRGIEFMPVKRDKVRLVEGKAAELKV